MSSKSKIRKAKHRQLGEELELCKKQLKNLPETIDKICSDIRNKGAHAGERYTREEKLKQYDTMLSYAEEFCRSRNCELSSFAKTNEDDSADVRKAKRDFLEVYYKVKNNKAILENGIKGERATYDAISILGDEIKIIPNVRVITKDKVLDEEHDFIIICKKGIFTVEVKNFNAESICISKQGLIFDKDDQIVDVNILEQSRRHKQSLVKLLEDTDFNSVLIRPVIVFSNDRCDVVNYNSIVPVCYRNNIESELFNEFYQDCMSKEQIDLLHSIIVNKCSKVKERTYPLEVSEADYYAAFADLAALTLPKIEKERLTREKNELKKEYAKTESVAVKALKGSGIAAAVGAVFVWAALSDD